MKGAKFFGLVGSVLMVLLFFSGCGWFSDNPMFPKAKVDISVTVLAEDGGEVSTGSLGIISVTSISNISSDTNTLSESITTTVTQQVYQGGTSTVTQQVETTQQQTQQTQKIDETQKVVFARVVKFTIHPINAVGGTIEKCTIEYTDENGRIISALTRTLALSVQFLPVLPDTLTGSNLYNQTTSFTLEIFTTEVEDYFVNNGITSGQAIVTFRGTDSALHAISYKETIPITCPPYEIPSVSLTQSSTSPSSTSSTCQSCF
ncbi:MAG: hypothetical protein HPY68_01595 [Candidatus Atribacteria bacterium]|nr:hypothetical protein [Candidatus Atribacteria bacterium]